MPSFPSYLTILGRNPDVVSPGARPVVVAQALPRLSEHEFKWVVAAALHREYAHWGFKVSAKSLPVNCHVYGPRSLIERLSRTGQEAVCELELVVKRLESGREFIQVNLYVVPANRSINHQFRVVGASPDPAKRPWYVYTTKDMGGVGISVRPLA